MPRPIACVYCGGSHPSADEVRACWSRSQAGDGQSSSAAPNARDVAPWDSAPDAGPVVRRSAEPGPSAEVADGSSLAADQMAAVTADGDTVRIIAPAGSGKTRVLTERARFLVHDRGVPAQQITLIAFNKRAQEEMSARTRNVPGMQVRTFNALGLAIVNGSRPFASRQDGRRTIDEQEVRRIIGRMVTFPKKRNADPVAPWIEALAVARLGMVDPAVVERRYDGDVEGFAEMLPRYRRELARQGVADFDEQIVLAIEALQAEPATLAAAQRSCRILLVDEFQDLTPAHLQLVKLLAGERAAVFAVGDDDQTIYGYNGADPGWLIDFSDHFPGAAEHALTVNYRCPTDVVAAADRLLRHNRRRVAKVIQPASTATPHGLTVSDDDDSVAATVAAVRGELGTGRPPADIAVLTRVNSLLAPVQAALVSHGVPVAGGVGRDFVERTAVRTALAWLRLARTDNWSPDDLAEALRRPSRSLHPRIATWVAEQSSLEGLERLANRVTNDRDAATIRDFAGDIATVRRAAQRSNRAADVLRLVRDGLGLGRAVAGLDAQRRGMNRAAQSDDLTALVQLADLHPETATFERWLTETLSKPWSPGGVTLATVHRVKGQEWPVVVVHHADAEQYPHRLADDLEEERRVFHVAITRGRERVIVATGDSPSRFVAEMFSDPPASPPVSDVAVPRDATRLERSMAASRPGHDLSGADAELFERLKDLRRHLANGKPAYVVFGDAVLDAMVRARPASLAELATLKGVGPAKLTQYGDAFLAVIDASVGQSTQE